MIEKVRIEESVREFIKGSGLFLVAVKVSSANRITVLADRNEGITIDECVAIHRHIEKCFDREAEDYELQVSSPGLDMPFGVIEQYRKNAGRKVQVTDTDGETISGILKNVTEGGFELEVETKIKGKPKELTEVSFNFDQVKSAKVVLSLK